jgi:hypothetical protein
VTLHVPYTASVPLVHSLPRRVYSLFFPDGVMCCNGTEIQLRHYKTRPLEHVAVRNIVMELVLTTVFTVKFARPTPSSSYWMMTPVRLSVTVYVTQII